MYVEMVNTVVAILRIRCVSYILISMQHLLQLIWIKGSVNV